MNREFLGFFIIYVIINIVVEIQDYNTVPKGYVENEAHVTSRGFLSTPLTIVDHYGKTYKYYHTSWTKYIFLQTENTLKLRYKFNPEKDRIEDARIMDFPINSFSLDKLMIHLGLLFFAGVFIETYYYGNLQE